MTLESIQNLPVSVQNCKAWIHVFNKPLSEVILETAEQMLEAFSQHWNAHGSSLTSSHFWFKDQVLVILQDQRYGSASGCSIDSKNHFIDDMCQKLDLSLQSNGMLYVLDDKDQLLAVNRSEFKEMYASSAINLDTLVVNTLCQGPELKDSFVLPLRKSWHSKMIQ